MKGNAYITGNYFDWMVDLSFGAWMYQQDLAYIPFYTGKSFWMN